MPSRLDELVEACKAAASQDEVLEIVRRAVEDPRELLAAAGPIEQQSTLTLWSSPTLTVQLLGWAPGMLAPPHEHRMWAVLGVCAGCEDNGYFRRTGSGIERDGGVSLRAGDVVAMPGDVIHDVRNPLDAFTVAVHVYGGDILHAPRNGFHPFTMAEEPFDWARVERLVAAFNERQRREPVPFAAANVPRIMQEILREEMAASRASP